MNTITIIIVKNEKHNFCYILQISLQSQQLCCAKFGISASDLFLASIYGGRCSHRPLRGARLSLFTSTASWSSFPLASAGNCSWSSRKSRSSATEGTSRGSSPCPPPSAIIREYVDVHARWVAARTCTTFRETPLTWQLYVYAKTSSSPPCNR